MDPERDTHVISPISPVLAISFPYVSSKRVECELEGGEGFMGNFGENAGFNNSNSNRGSTLPRRNGLRIAFLNGNMRHAGRSTLKESKRKKRHGGSQVSALLE